MVKCYNSEGKINTNACKMEIHLIPIFTFSLIFFKASLQQSSVAQIFPNKPDITVDAYTDLTLGCRGAEPMNWTFHDAVNAPHFNTSLKNITYMENKKELKYKYETILTLYNVSHVNVGFYYCHGEKVDFDTPRRSTRIYVFVHDDYNLSVIISEKNKDYTQFNPIPCRPTSPDTNVTLICDPHTMFVTPSNYSGVQVERYIMIRFHPYYGFTFEHVFYPTVKLNCYCVFMRNDRKISVHMKPLLEYAFLVYETSIEGPDTADVGTDITLQCTYLGSQYFPYDKHWLQWDIPNSGNKLMTKLQIIKLKFHVILMNTITLKNISAENEGIFKCEFINNLQSYNKGIMYINADSKYVFVNDNHSAPLIHSPNGSDIQINSGENITLRCTGYRPITWLTQTQVNRYTEYSLNNKIGLYESILHLIEPRYKHTGFYYCYEKDSVPENPFKSARIYIYVKDEQHLYVTRESEYDAYFYTNKTVPCLPTSLDVKVSLSLERSKIWGPTKMVDSVIYSFDPREGFTIQMPAQDYGVIYAKCTFATETATNTLTIPYTSYDALIKSEPLLTGPHEDFVFVGQTLELSCTVFVPHNIADNALRWRTPNRSTSNEIIVEENKITSKYWKGKVLISKLILNNVKDADEGRYFCDSTYNNATARKFISVYEKFLVTPIIEVSQYPDAYIGQLLVLRCKVNVDHNVGFHMSWTTPNGTETKGKGTEYIPEIEYISGESILHIDNVTDEIKGNYTCFVFDFSNRRRNVTKHILVKKGVAPTIVTNNFQEIIDVQLEETVNLTCFAEGDPPPKITWMKGSSVVQRLDQPFGFASKNSELIVHYEFVQERNAGLYTCLAGNPFGQVSRTVNLRVNTGSLSKYIPTFIIVLIVCVSVTVLLAIKSHRYKKLRKELYDVGFINFQSGQLQSLHSLLNIQEQANLLPYDIKWEIPSSKIKLGHNLGSGCFGLVVEATVSNFFDEEPERTVAVKMLHPNSNFLELNSLISELKILAHLGEHVNLINLVGACTEKIAIGKLLVVLEYCEHGDLSSYLIKNRCNFVNLMDPDTELICLPADYSEEVGWSGVSTLQLLRWALQMARGMEFLAAKQILHGDLAARNVLLAENYVLKISDFGMSKTLSSSGYYKKKSQCPLPVKWMAIESIRDKTFSTQSDVWAFGVVLWELFSLARTPYAELEPDFRFYRKLDSGYRLEQPEYSTREVYQVMRECWHEQPQCRPTFTILARTLDDLLQEPNNRCCVDGVTEDSAHRTAVSSLAVRSDDTATPDWIALDILDPTQKYE